MPLNAIFMAQPDSMYPRSLRPNNSCIINNQAKNPWSLHLVEAFPPGSLLTCVARVAFHSLMDFLLLLPISNLILRSHHSTSHWTQRQISLSGWLFWLSEFSPLLATCFSPKLLCNRYLRGLGFTALTFSDVIAGVTHAVTCYLSYTRMHEYLILISA